jgi:hypothetical protein
MRLSLPTAFVLAVAVYGLGGRTYADPITLANGGGNQSNVQAFASDDDGGTTSTNNVNSLPFTTPTTVADGDNSSTVNSALSTSALNFGYIQEIDDTESPSQTSGEGDIFFKAGANVTYSIAGSMTVTGDFVEGELATSLYDVTTSTYAYNYDQDTGFVGLSARPATPVGSSTLTLDTSGGSLTGSLNAGDTYEFDAYQEMDNEFGDPNLTGNVGISFNQLQSPGGGSSVPLPSAAMSGLASLLGLGIVLAGRRKIAVA